MAMDALHLGQNGKKDSGPGAGWAHWQGFKLDLSGEELIRSLPMARSWIIDEIEGQSAGGGSHLLHLMMNILGSELTGLITRAYNA